MSAPEICPNCGADVPPKAKACPECGSDEKTGWSDDAQRENLGITDDNFDYGDFVKREFESEKIKPRGLPWGWWIVAVIVLIAFVVILFR
jgi:uncharacterized membrane protein YvbJ